MASSYLDSDRLKQTIAAIATASGAGAIGIVRLSGEHALRIGASIFSKSSRITDAPSHTIQVGTVVSTSGEQLDQVLALVMRAPNSYTGENTLEYQVHGGTVQSDRVLQACIEAGAVPGLPGEFTFRAFYNGKMDLTQAEAVTDLIGARTEAAARLALQTAGGMLRRQLERVGDDLVTLRARCEAGIDFVEDDTPDEESPVLLNMLDELLGQLRELNATFDTGRLLREGARVVLTGAPNVGKSSLFNAILKSDRAIVTEVPGTTRDALTEMVDLGGIPVILADTAGMRDGGDKIEREGMKRSEAYKEEADLILEVVDVSRETFDSVYTEARTLRVGNKVDLLGGIPDRNGTECYVSAANGQGVSELCEMIAMRLGSGPVTMLESAVTRRRHHEGLKACINNLDRARDGINQSAPLEVVALELRGASTAIDEIVGKVYDDDVLNRIFGEFCIGK